MTEPESQERVSVERVLALHAAGIEDHGGSPDIKGTTEDCAEGAIENAHQSAYYRSLEESTNLVLVACYALRSLAQNHCFEDGNKRVAWMVFIEYLLLHDLVVDETDEVVVKVVNNVAQGFMTLDALYDWTRARLRSRE